MKKIALVIVVVALGCGRPHAGTPPIPTIDYANTLRDARERVDSGDYTTADRVLAAFALRHSGSPEAREIAFWRALYMVDPANTTAPMADGVRALDIYLASDSTLWHRSEAEVLRRSAQYSLALGDPTQPARRIIGRDTVIITRDEEVVSLRAQLAQANAELERIKRRLANPTR